MIDHKLTALRGNSPLGFLAGLGVLVTVSKTRSQQPARLSWDVAPPHMATLRTMAKSGDELAEIVYKELVTESLAPVRALKSLTLDSYRTLSEELSDGAALLRGIISDATDDEKPLRGPLVMTGGPQDFVLEVRKLRSAVRAGGAGEIQTTLKGTWNYQKGHPLGFDPLMERQHGYLGIQPAKDSYRVPGAVLLAITAIELLPLYPAVGQGRISNSLFRERRWESMAWPLWDVPLDKASVVSLLAIHGTGGREAPVSGVFAEFASARKEIKTAGGSYRVLRHARRVF